jgi:hypothetical protein
MAAVIGWQQLLEKHDARGRAAFGAEDVQSRIEEPGLRCVSEFEFCFI